MKRIGSQIRETLSEAGYCVLCQDQERAILIDLETGNHEEWVKNDHHSGYTIEINGEGYEFVTSLTPA